MAVSWSDPQPSNATAASLMGSAHINDPGYSLGHIVSSILQFRQEEARRQQQQQQQNQQNVLTAARMFQQNNQANAANDAANATMYGIQNPNDPYGGFQDPNRVPDYGGTDALRALESAKSMGAYQDPTTRALHQAQLDAEQARAWKTWNEPYGANYGAPDINASAANALSKQAGDMLGVSPGELNNVTRGEFDAQGNFVPNASGSQAMVGAPHTASWPAKSGFFGLGGSPAGSGTYDYSNVYPANQVDKAVGLYRQAMNYLGLGLTGGATGATGMGQGAPAAFGGDNTTYTPGQGNLRMEGGMETATGAPMHTIESGEATLAVNPLDKALLGQHGYLVDPQTGNMISRADVTDTGPGVHRHNFDIASSNPALAYSTPDILARAKFVAAPGNSPAMPGELPSPPAQGETAYGRDLTGALSGAIQGVRGAATAPSGAVPGSTPTAYPVPASLDPAKAAAWARANPTNPKAQQILALLNANAGQ